MQPIKYRIVVRGLRPGHAVEPTAAALARLLRREPAQIAPLLGAGRPLFLNVPDLAAARRYQALLSASGCDCAIDPDPDLAPVPAAAVPQDFSQLKLRPFVSLGFGLVFNAPEAWEDRGSQDHFQVVEPGTGTQFTASAYQSPGATLEQWMQSRLGAVEKGMPFLRRVKAPYELQCPAGTGVAAEYRGVFPQTDYETHYLVLCLVRGTLALSFTVSARSEVFGRQEALYRWLLQNQLDIYELRKAEPPKLPRTGARRSPPAAAAAAGAAPRRQWTAATPTSRRSGSPLPLGSIAAGLVVLAVVLLMRRHGGGSPKAEPIPPLPPALAAIRCVAPNGMDHNFARLGGLGMFMPCSDGLARMAIDKAWHDGHLTPAQVLASRMPVDGPFAWNFYYKRLPQGGFSTGPVDLWPEAKNEVYSLTIAFAMPRPDLEQLPRPEGAGWFHDPWEVTVPLPAALGAAQDSLVFHCDGPQHANGYSPLGQYYCIGQFKADPGVWRVTLRFGRPMPQELDLSAAFAEALDLAAAHIGPPARP
jgi:hypothetical protein